MDQSLISNFEKGDVNFSGKCEVILLAASRDALYTGTEDSGEFFDTDCISDESILSKLSPREGNV